MLNDYYKELESLIKIYMDLLYQQKCLNNPSTEESKEIELKMLMTLKKLDDIKLMIKACE